MSDPRLDAFFSRHESESTEVRDALAAWNAGGEASLGPRAVPARELLDIYRARAVHLSSKPTDHAHQLAAQITAFCDAIAPHPDREIAIVSVTTADGRSFTFFEEARSSKLVGSLYSYDARKISDEEYLRVWGQARPPSPDGAA